MALVLCLAVLGTAIAPRASQCQDLHDSITHALTFTPIDVPGASITGPRGINPEGDIVGFYLDVGLGHGLLQLRNVDGCQVTAHLLVPGFTYTGLIQRRIPEKPPAAWTAGQVVDHMLEALQAGAFYILCPDNETPPEVDAKRILWGAGDIVRGRPALSRWHPGFKAACDEHMASSPSL